LGIIPCGPIDTAAALVVGPVFTIPASLIIAAIAVPVAAYDPCLCGDFYYDDADQPPPDPACEAED
jgi:hypothetical protein